MIPIRVQLLSCALVLGGLGVASAGEVEATEVCRHRSAYSARSCYNPCEPVGPVRQFLRRAFLPPCPRPCPPQPVYYAPQAPTFCPPSPCPPRPIVYAPPAPTYAPPAYAQPVPPANLGRPTPPPAPPAPGETAFPAVPSARHPRLTPPVAPPPVRLERLASRNGE